MKESLIIARSGEPITARRIADDLRKLGVREGDVVLVHSSLSALGWVCGGPQTAVQAMLAAVGESGTLVMPAHSGDWSDPAEWENPPVPERWIAKIREEMPAFDPALTPTRGMGRIAELFRTFPGTVRSNHPQVSFCANGQEAHRIVAEHPLTPQLGDGSPLGELYASGAKVLLLGVGYDSCTSLHLAEARWTGMPRKEMGAAIFENGRRLWKTFEDYAYDSGDFAAIGDGFERRGTVRRGEVGIAECRLFGVKEAVDFAEEWLPAHRKR